VEVAEVVVWLSVVLVVDEKDDVDVRPVPPPHAQHARIAVVPSNASESPMNGATAGSQKKAMKLHVESRMFTPVGAEPTTTARSTLHSSAPSGL
jgi:hypothetical protein